MALFQGSSTTFGQAKSVVAEACGKQSTTEFLDRAGRAIQYAIRKWNTVNWKWAVRDASDIAVVAGTSKYALPFDFSDAYAVRLTASFQRWLMLKPRREYDRAVWNQVNSYPIAYNLLYSGDGYLQLMPTPNTSDTLQLKYYKNMTVPCSITLAGVGTLTNGSATVVSSGTAVLSGAKVGNPIYSGTAIVGTLAAPPAQGSQSLTMVSVYTGTTTATASLTIGGDGVYLDFPDEFENGIIAEACTYFCAGLGRSMLDQASYWGAIASREYADAQANNNAYEDEDVAFLPPTDEAAYLQNPNVILE